MEESGGKGRRRLRVLAGGKSGGPSGPARRQRPRSPEPEPPEGGERRGFAREQGTGARQVPGGGRAQSLTGRRRGALGGRARLLGAIPEVVWAPTVALVLCLAAGLLGLAVGQPWLFPSLGPTAFLQAHQVTSKTSSFYNTLAGHTIGIGVGYAMVALFALGPATALFKLHDLTAGRVWASVLAVGLTLLIQLPLKAYHPPAAATTLLIALGGFRQQWSDVLALFAGVFIVAVLGEGFRVLRERGLPQEQREQKAA